MTDRRTGYADGQKYGKTPQGYDDALWKEAVDVVDQLPIKFQELFTDAGDYTRRVARRKIYQALIRRNVPREAFAEEAKSFYSFNGFNNPTAGAIPAKGRPRTLLGKIGL